MLEKAPEENATDPGARATEVLEMVDDLSAYRSWLQKDLLDPVPSKGGLHGGKCMTGALVDSIES